MVGSAHVKKVLIVDDDALIRLALQKFIQKQEFEVDAVDTGKKALDRIEADEPDFVLLDLRLADSLDGIEVLKIIKDTRPQINVIIISGQGEVHGAVEAMKFGAYDYLEKPIDFERLQEILHELTAEAAGERELSAMDNMICTSNSMRKVLDVAKRLAVKSDLTILVLGETGTGKNYLCKKIHELSPRSNGAYVQIGCSNIPGHLIESELFGYEKGSFTDAKDSKKGLVEVAEFGTLLLDEIGEMPYEFQSKILTLLEEKRFRRIGSLHDNIADVRILAATNRDLNEQVKDKKFRLDLYYRLNVATIELPPLRDRKGDIPLLVKAFLEQFSKKYDAGIKSIAPEGMSLLQSYPWPGNVRELKNLIEKLVVLSEGEEIGIDEVSSNLVVQHHKQESSPQVEDTFEIKLTSGLSLQSMEEEYIKTALRLTGGNQRKAATLLCISRDTLRYRLKKLGIAAD